MGEMHAFGGFGYPALQGAKHVAVYGDVAYVAGSAKGTVAAVDAGGLVADDVAEDELGVIDEGLAALDGLGMDAAEVLEGVTALAVASEGAALVAIVGKVAGAQEGDESVPGAFVLLE